jgi:antitoxin component YwqK of YwqJK toxin-antitoxin module
MMRYFVFLLVCVFCSQNCVGQSSTYFYGQNGSETIYGQNGSETNRANSHYSITYSKQESTISHYTKTGNIRFKEKSIGKDSLFQSFYYESGELKAETIFYRGKPKGLVKTFHKNGKSKSELMYEEFDFKFETDSPIKILNYWNEKGDLLVENGNGKFEGQLDPYSESDLIEVGDVANQYKVGEWLGKSVCEEFSFKELYDSIGNLLVGNQINKGGKFEYSRIESPAVPVGGLTIFYKQIGNAIAYPKKARRLGVEGKVFVQFMVQKDGTLTDIEVRKGIGAGCD